MEPVETGRQSLPAERVLVFLHAQLVLGDIAGFLLPDVFGDRRLVQPDGRHVVALRPELPVAELVLQVRVPVEYHQRALALQVSHHARHAVFRRYGHQHVHVVGHQVPLYDLDALVLAELPGYLPYVLPDLVVDDLAPILRREHDVVLAHPLRVRQAVRFLRHGLHTLSSRVLDGLNNRQYRAGGWFCKADCHPPA